MSNLARVDALRVVAFGSITSSYTPLGTAFLHAMRILHFVNNTNALIYISFDGGVTDHLVLPALTFTLYDLTSDQDYNENFRYQIGTQIALKYSGSAATTGSVYLTAIYGKGE